MEVRMHNILSIDVEDYFHLMEHPLLPGPSEWDNLPSRVQSNFTKLLDLFIEKGVKGTCFFLGWVAERFPNLVKTAADSGFGIASHGYYHRPVYKQVPDEFGEDVSRAKKVCEDITGKEVYGYRAPAFSITERTPWAMEKLIEAGYRYDSSIFPASRDFGGLIIDKLKPHIIKTARGSILEFPISITNVLGKRFYFFGGGYFRLFPYWMIKMMAQKVIAQGRPIILYIHPRDIDSGQPRYRLGLVRNFKSYVNLGSTEDKLRRFMDDFKFTSYDKWLKMYKSVVT
ncbi:MAG: DUF3473 domain-containing protein [candidate division Zixibacteria bacterium]|nr:DUF3473 domain-containing protein [candidate division Zixibacteria bacterium]